MCLVIRRMAEIQSTRKRNKNKDRAESSIYNVPLFGTARAGLYAWKLLHWRETLCWLKQLSNLFLIKKDSSLPCLSFYSKLDMKSDLLSLLLWTLMTAYHWETFCLGLGVRAEAKNSLHSLKCTEKCSRNSLTAAARRPVHGTESWASGRGGEQKSCGLRGEPLLQTKMCKVQRWVHSGKQKLPTSCLHHNRFMSCHLPWSIKQVDKNLHT